MTTNRKAAVKHLTPLIAIAAILLIPSTAHAWDLRGATTAGDCQHVTGTISSERSNPTRGDAKLRWEIDGRSQSASVNYGPNAETFVFNAGVPQDGKAHSLRVSWIDHDGDESAVNSYRLTCGTPSVTPPSSPPATPPNSPPSTPPSSPPTPPKVCVPSGTTVDLHKTGPRSFALTGKARHIRWRLGGNLLQRGGRTVTVPGDSTGRLVVRYRANCQPGKLVGVVTDSPPPETAG